MQARFHLLDEALRVLESVEHLPHLHDPVKHVLGLHVALGVTVVHEDLLVFPEMIGYPSDGMSNTLSTLFPKHHFSKH